MDNTATKDRTPAPNTVFIAISGFMVWASSLAFIQFTSGDTAVFVNPEKSVNTQRYK